MPKPAATVSTSVSTLATVSGISIPTLGATYMNVASNVTAPVATTAGSRLTSGRFVMVAIVPPLWLRIRTNDLNGVRVPHDSGAVRHIDTTTARTGNLS